MAKKNIFNAQFGGGVEISIPEFGGGMFDDHELEQDNRYIKLKPYEYVPDNLVMYEHAENLAKCFELTKGCRYHAILSGNFILGDLIEAIIVQNNCFCKRLTISTLSYSEENIQSLSNLINGGFIGELNLIVSDYFFSHERNGLIRAAFKALDRNDIFNLAVAGSHTKTCLIESKGGKKLVMHGSANLRSSRNIEQISIEENEDLYDGYWEYQRRIIEKYKIDKKAARGGKLWDLII